LQILVFFFFFFFFLFFLFFSFILQLLMSDDLQTARNALWLGSYSRAMQEANAQPQSEARDVLLHRIFAARGDPSLVLAEVADAPETPLPLRAVRTFAELCAAAPHSPEAEAAAARLSAWLEDPESSRDTTVRTIAALAHLTRGDAQAALRASHIGSTFELKCTAAVSLTALDRDDLAASAQAAMSREDDDHVLTSLLLAVVSARAGGRRAQEAVAICDDLTAMHGRSPALLTAHAAALMALHRWAEADEKLAEALAIAPNCADALANSVVAAAHLARPRDQADRLMRQLEAAAPQHPLIARKTALEASFDRLARAAEASAL
jgi:tetratricopeptide (TPR) repeat protein